MKEILIHIGLVALIAFILYRIVKSIIENIKREQFRKKNRETQFSGSAVKEEKGFWTSMFTPKYSSRAEAIGDYGEKRVSSFLEDLDYEHLRRRQRPHPPHARLLRPQIGPQSAARSPYYAFRGVASAPAATTRHS